MTLKQTIERFAKEVAIASKSEWNMADLMAYTGWGRTHAYEVMKKVGYYRPNGKEMWVDSAKIKAYLKQNYVMGSQEMETIVTQKTFNR